MGICSDGNGGGTKKYGFNGTSTIILVLVLLQLLLINLSPQDCFDDDNGGNGGDSGGDDACRDGGDIARTCENAFSTVGSKSGHRFLKANLNRLETYTLLRNWK